MLCWGLQIFCLDVMVSNFVFLGSIHVRMCVSEFVCASCGFFFFGCSPHLFCPTLVLIFLDACCILMGERKEGCEFGWAGKERRILEELGDRKLIRIYYMKTPIFNKITKKFLLNLYIIPMRE